MARGRREGGRQRRRERKNVTEGVAHIQATFNNTIITITDIVGNVICWEVLGHTGLRDLGKVHPSRSRSGSTLAT